MLSSLVSASQETLGERWNASAELRESFWPNLELIDEIATILLSESSLLRFPKSPNAQSGPAITVTGRLRRTNHSAMTGSRLAHPFSAIKA
jgi:hypothetical protein